MTSTARASISEPPGRPVPAGAAGRAAATAGPGRAWAGLGVVAGLAGIASVVASGLSGAVYADDVVGDPVRITDRLAEQVPQILVFHTTTMVSALTMVVFAAGLHAQLSRRVGPDSVLPGTASLGLVLVAAAQLMGTALTTEFVFGLADPDLLVPETAVLFGHWIGTVPWLWAGAGLAAVAVAAAARRGAYPRWLGWTSMVLGGLVLVIAASPLQYLAGMVGPVWLSIAALALLRSARED